MSDLQRFWLRALFPVIGAVAIAELLALGDGASRVEDDVAEVMGGGEIGGQIGGVAVVDEAGNAPLVFGVDGETGRLPLDDGILEAIGVFGVFEAFAPHKTRIFADVILGGEILRGKNPPADLIVDPAQLNLGSSGI